MKNGGRQWAEGGSKKTAEEKYPGNSLSHEIFMRMNFSMNFLFLNSGFRPPPSSILTVACKKYYSSAPLRY
jgi:hypothetical protein